MRAHFTGGRHAEETVHCPICHSDLRCVLGSAGRISQATTQSLSSSDPHARARAHRRTCARTHTHTHTRGTHAHTHTSISYTCVAGETNHTRALKPPPPPSPPPPCKLPPDSPKAGTPTHSQKATHTHTHTHTPPSCVPRAAPARTRSGRSISATTTRRASGAHFATPGAAMIGWTARQQTSTQSRT